MAAGSPFFLPHGTTIINRLVEYLREQYRTYGYQEVCLDVACVFIVTTAGAHAAGLQHGAVAHVGPPGALRREHVFRHGVHCVKLLRMHCTDCCPGPADQASCSIVLRIIFVL